MTTTTTATPKGPKTPMLDDILASKPNDAEPSAAEMERRRAIVEAAEAAIVADAGPAIAGEEDATTFEALADFYDVKRDNALEQLAGVLAGYGAESDKRKGRMTAAVATPFLEECRRLFTIAGAAQLRAKIHRDAHYRAK